MSTYDTWQEALSGSFVNLWERFVNFLPDIVSALLVLIVGLIIASAAGHLVTKLISFTKVDKLFEQLGITKKLDEVGFKFSFASLIGLIVKWFLIIGVWIAVLEVFQLEAIGSLLEKIVLFLPNVVTAIIILAVGVVGGMLVSQVVKRSVTASHLSADTASLLAAISRWSIVIFSGLIALTQLGIATRLIEILFVGLVIMFSLAGGLAFGLGGKQKASEIIDKLNQEIKK